MANAVNEVLEQRSDPLRNRQLELLARLEKITAARRRYSGSLEADFAEQAVQRENDEVLDALDETERSELARIQLAKRRIDAGCFGICDGCGEEIDPLRLDVAPESPRCVPCQRKLEESEARGR